MLWTHSQILKCYYHKLTNLLGVDAGSHASVATRLNLACDPAHVPANADTPDQSPRAACGVPQEPNMCIKSTFSRSNPGTSLTPCPEDLARLSKDNMQIAEAQASVLEQSRLPGARNDRSGGVSTNAPAAPSPGSLQQQPVGSRPPSQMNEMNAANAATGPIAEMQRALLRGSSTLSSMGQKVNAVCGTRALPDPSHASPAAKVIATRSRARGAGTGEPQQPAQLDPSAAIAPARLDCMAANAAVAQAPAQQDAIAKNAAAVSPSPRVEDASIQPPAEAQEPLPQPLTVPMDDANASAPEKGPPRKLVCVSRKRSPAAALAQRVSDTPCVDHGAFNPQHPYTARPRRRIHVAPLPCPLGCTWAPAVQAGPPLVVPAGSIPSSSTCIP